MSTRMKTRMFVVVVCALQVLAIGLYFRNRAEFNNVSAADARNEAAEKERVRREELNAGVPIQRKRIDDFIAQTGAYPDFEALAAGLNDRLKEDILFPVGMQSSASSPEMEFAVVLADRRAARLYMLLQDLAPDEAARRAAALVDAKVEIQRKFLAEYFAAGRLEVIDGDEPGKFYVPNFTTARRNFHASSAALFLCASFCDVLTTLQKIDRWNDVIGSLVDEALANPESRKEPLLRSDAERHGRPQRLFLINLYAFLLQRHASWTAQDLEREAEFHRYLYAPAFERHPDFTVEQIEERYRVKLPGLFYEQVPFCAWDADTNYFDFTHVHRGAPVDDANVLVVVDYARNWGALQARIDEQEALLARVRDLVGKVVDKERVDSKK